MALPPPRAGATAIVTGASSGIGEALARDLAKRGYGLTLVARNQARLEALADELRDAGVHAVVMVADLADRGARASLVERVNSLGLVPDILVNNAGLSTRGPVSGCDPDAELHMIEVDAVAVADLCARFLPGMVERARGAILNVSSTTAFQPVPGQAGYAAAKAFVLSYTRTLAAELDGTGVSVCVLCPGPVETPFITTAGFSVAQARATLAEAMWESAPDVARAGIDALEAGRVLSVPGRANQAGALVAAMAMKKLLTS